MIDDDEVPPPSKTRRKHEMAALQALGEELVALPAEQVKKVDVPEDLRAAVLAAQRMTRPDDARRRQLQYVGRLMRNVEVQPIRAALAEARGESTVEIARLHRLEQLRSALLADEKTLQTIAASYPAIDLQHLRSLRRAALREQQQNKPPRSYRAIFQLLKELDTGEPPAPGENQPG
ncbi:MAG: ribosome biogenesis factor YjgA [Propionivibrio sp.]